uniref:RRM domain-containing protein n=1 Tax=Neobodo designis TaxID=312471 RepID=A0A6U4PDL6_NEODS|mmetsp:Transcript_13787/g.42914  ORF Transcript_13787/g.42914 Transcript_13787/m.42914 type:complete len:476 (+) Transcript_13787:180-1607(+)|eukprot:CAMPEP_0174850788 /NCGR_PEP_ID=MMETSP1114-20130205/21140_1 /TAXON_ID=312471 /ORGANISM="Neobodo designis, Strain CCAP 1951/1" /LENGTH=475 /DNA_ID=CAMNT_0016085275 /DNA_START=183 /DNA_END=1610 /DNA_ORIENTATION=-
MSNSNSPQQRPVQHNPYSITPMQQPADARGDVPAPPPMEGTPKTAGAPVRDDASGARPPSGSGHKTGSPHLSFMPSLYAATPQHGPKQGRVSPGPSLGPAEQDSHAQQQQQQTQPSQQQQQGPARFTAFSSAFGGSGGGGMSGSEGRGGGGGGGAFASWGPSAYASAMAAGNSNNNTTVAGGFHGNDFPTYAMPNNAGGGGGGGGFGSTFGGSTFGRPNAPGGGGANQQGSGSNFTSTFGPPREFTPYAPPSHAAGGGGGAPGSAGPGQGQPHGMSRGRGGREGGVPRGMSGGRVAHTFLNGKLRYIPLPGELFVQLPPQRLQTQMGEIDRPIQMYSGRGREMQTVCPTADLFVAQLPFNMELSALQMIFDAVASISCDIMHAAPHYKRGRSYDGCAFVKVSQAVAAILVETFHKAALFDQEGVWIADTPDQRDALAQYCGFMQQKSPQERRQILQKPIPFSAMTVEFANRSYSF